MFPPTRLITRYSTFCQDRHIIIRLRSRWMAHQPKSSIQASRQADSFARSRAKAQPTCATSVAGQQQAASPSSTATSIVAPNGTASTTLRLMASQLFALLVSRQNSTCAQATKLSTSTSPRLATTLPTSASTTRTTMRAACRTVRTSTSKICSSSSTV